MARNFSEDGAIGAMTGGTPGTQTGGFTSGSLTPSIMNNFNMTGTPADKGSTMPIGLGDPGSDGGWGGGGLAPKGYGSDGSSVGAIPTGDILGGAGGWGGSGGGLAPRGYGGGGGGMGSPGGGAFPASPSWSFAKGGAIDESMGDPNATDPQGSQMGNKLQLQINAALSTVDNIMSYGRQLHGIGGGQQQAMNTEGFRQSDNVEDRRDGSEDTAGTFGRAVGGSAGAQIARNVRDNSATIADKAKNMFAADQTKNKMSQDAGINDIGGDGGPAQAGSQQAIPTDEEEAQ